MPTVTVERMRADGATAAPEHDDPASDSPVVAESTSRPPVAVALLLDRGLSPALGGPGGHLSRPGVPRGVAQRMPAVPARILPGGIEQSTAAGAPLPARILPGGIEQSTAAGAPSSHLSAAPVPLQRATDAGRRAAPASPFAAQPSSSLGASTLIADAPGSTLLDVLQPDGEPHGPSMVQRSAASALPVRLPVTTSSDARARTSEGASAASVPQIDPAHLRAVQRVLARNAAAYEATAVETNDSGVEVQRAQEAMADAGSPPEVPDATASAMGASAAPGAAGAGAAGGAVSAATEVRSPAEMEKLIDRIYAPLVRRLKAEMLTDRERRGVRIDRI